VLGKKIGVKIIEAKFQHIWARAGKIRIINMSDGYFLV